MQLPWHQSGDHIITTDATFWLGSWTFKPLLSYQLNHRKEFHAYYDAAQATATLDMSLRTSRFDFKAFKQTKDKEWILGAQGMHQSMLNEGAEQLIPDALTEEQAIFTLLNYKYVDWQWQAGARLDRRYIDVVSTTYLNPSFSLGASCEMGKQFLLKMNAAQGFRAPNLFELKAAGVQRGFLRYEQGNPELVSEQNRELDLSLHWRGEQSLLDLTLFYNYIQDYIYRKATTELYEGYTVYKHLQEDAVLTGAELGFDWHPYDWHWMRIKTTAAYLNAKTLESAEPLPLIPPLKWTAEISAEKEEWKGFRNAYFSVSTEYTFAQELVADNEAPSKAYSIMHMSAGASLSKHLDVGLSVNNLLNTAYVPHLSFLKEYGIYEPARNFMLKLTAHF
jgi:iron complex outermembrane recepter protein